MREIDFFLHITKTAGGSIKKLLGDQLNKGVVLFHNSHENVPPLQDNTQMVFGHFLVDIHEKYEGIKPNYLCFLRNPINRVVSHYYHLYNVDKSPVGDKIRSGGDDINEYFKQVNHWEFSNAMCKIIAGINVFDQKWSDERKLSIAMENMRSFKFVGIYEFLELSLVRLSKLYNLDIAHVPSVNIGSYKFSKINEETIRKIIRINKYDWILYNYGVDLFWKQISKGK